jgi:enoyl-CoA hydratase
MEDDLVLDRLRPGVALLQLNRPERLNALTEEQVGRLHELLSELQQENETRVLIVTGVGRGFCAGLDLRAEVGRTNGPVEQTRQQEKFASVVSRLRELPQIVIAAVNGPAVGAGLGLALGADLRVAATSASFHVGAIRIGLSAGECGISYLLPRYIGAARAFERMLTGQPIDADEARAWGLVSRLVDPEQLLDESVALAEAVLANSPFAVEMTKRVMWRNLDTSFETAFDNENRLQVICALTSDCDEAMKAFTEKRAPAFTGS